MVKKSKKEKKVLLGYTGSWAFGVWSFYAIDRLKGKLAKTKGKGERKKILREIKALKEKRAGNCSPVYVSKERYDEMKAHQKLHEYDAWL